MRTGIRLKFDARTCGWRHHSGERGQKPPEEICDRGLDAGEHENTPHCCCLHVYTPLFFFFCDLFSSGSPARVVLLCTDM